MKIRIICTILSLICFTVTLTAQDIMNVHKTDNTETSILLSDIDSLTFSNSETQLNINKSGSVTSSFQIAEIDSITFGNESVATDAIKIYYADNTAYVTNPYNGNGVTVTVTGQDVTITSTKTDAELQYVISGTTTSGSLKIYGSYKFNLMLNGANITNPNGAAINNQCKKKTTITLMDGTTNSLTDGSTYTLVDGEDMKGAFFSEGQLVFEGNGSLSVQGNYGHAIASDDYVRISSGDITITGAVKDGIHCDYFELLGGTLNVTASSDGIEAEEGYVLISDGDLTINSGDDAIVASYETVDASVTPYVQIDGGTIDITTSDQKGAGIKSDISSVTINGGTINVAVTGIASKAFSSGGDMYINNGSITLQTTGGGYFDTDDQDVSAASAIKCDGNLVITDGTLSTNSSGAGGKGISVDGTLTINGGSVNVTTSGAQYVYGSYDTAAKAIKSDGNLYVNGGNIVINTSKTEAEGLESKDSLFITGGTIEITAYDDGINASNHIQIDGGSIYVYSSVNDGIDSNGTITITGGLIISSGAASPEGGIDSDQSTFKITGGIIIGIGGSTSTPTASVSTQRSLIYGAGSVTSGQVIQIKSSTDNILVFKVPRAYSSMTMLFSTPDMASGTTYTIVKGASVSGGSDWHGYYTGATVSGGSTAYTFNPTSMVTTVGNTGGGGGRP